MGIVTLAGPALKSASSTSWLSVATEPRLTVAAEVVVTGRVVSLGTTGRRTRPQPNTLSGPGVPKSTSVRVAA